MSDLPIPESQYLTANGLKIHYLDEGEGHPVVFLHGSGPGASGYSNFKLNYPQFAAAGYRCIVLDLPGYGRSDKPEDAQYINDFFIEVLHGVLAELNVGPVTLLGNSLGGAIALGYVLSYPEQVSRMILMAPGGVEEREAYFEMEGIKRMMTLFAQGPLDTNSMRKLLGFQLFDASQVTDETVAERVSVCALQPPTVLSTMRVPNYESRLNEIQCPTLGFWGMNDQFNPLSGAQKVASGIADCKMTLINQCGHWVMVEHTDYFNRACIDFLGQS